MSLPGSFVTTPAGRVFVHRGGKGAPLLLLHGWMMSHWYFRPVLDVLAAEREIIALDLPGHGESDRPSATQFAYDFPVFADVVDGVLGQLGIARADVLGHSMGGGTALTLAARHPERVQRLIVVAAPLWRPPALPVDAQLALLPGIGGLLFKHAYRRAEFARACRSFSVRDGRILDDEYVDYFWARLQRARGMEAAYACMRMLCTLPEDNGDPGRVRAPTLLVWGDEDRLVPLAQGRRLHRAMPGARLAVVPACGHTPFYERPDEFLRIVRPFLAAEAAPAVESASAPRRAHSVVVS